MAKEVDSFEQFEELSEQDRILAVLGAFLGGECTDITKNEVSFVQDFFQDKIDLDSEELEETIQEYADKFDEYSYGMIETIVENLDDEERELLYYQLFVTAYAVSMSSHSFFRAQFLVRSQEMFEIGNATVGVMTTSCANAIGVSENEVSAFYAQMKSYASTKNVLLTKRQIAEHNWQHNIIVNYKENDDIDSLALMQELSALMTSGKITNEEFNERLSEEADKGNSFALYTLGSRYFIGKGIKQDIRKAISLLTQAADKGDIQAYYPLALIYEKNDYTEDALEYYRLSADEGNMDALFHYGVMLFENTDDEEDKTMGLTYIRHAAYNGVLDAAEYLKKL